MEWVANKSIAKPIILLKILDDKRLVVIDSETTVRYFNKEDLEFLSGFKVGIEHQYYKTDVVTFSNNGNYFATLSADAKEARFFNAYTKKMITKVDRHHGKVSCVAIDPLSRYMFSCGEDGKSFALDAVSGKLIFTLPLHTDTINDIAFSRNGNWVATAGYDRKISLFSLLTMTPKNILKAHATPIMHLRFFHKNSLISIDKNTSAIIWNIKSGKVVERLKGIHDEVTALVFDTDEKFLFLGTQLGYILVYDLSNYKLISAKYIKITSTIRRLEFDTDRNFLILATEDGSLLYYDIYEGINTFETLLKLKKFAQIQKLLDNNPLLEYTKIYAHLMDIWQESLQKAKLVLQKGDKEAAKVIFGEFRYMPAKNSLIQKVIREYNDFPKFIQLIKEGKLNLAYGLANKFPLYKESTAYEALQKRWKKAFSQAQKYVLNPKTAPLAKEVLLPYRGLSEKTKFIQDLLSKSEIYKRFRSAISKKEFKICSELTKQNAFLRELPEYDSLMKYADSLYVQSQKLMQEGELHAAIKILRVLQDFEEFRDEAHNFMMDLEAKAKFFNAVRDEDMATAYNMMTLSEDLTLTQEGQKLEDVYNRDLETAKKSAAYGDANGVRVAMQKYMLISSKYRALATIFAFTYMVQLEKALQEKELRQNIETGIKNYILNFGLSEQIEAFYNLFKDAYPETKLNLELLKKGSFSMWRPSMIVDSILSE
jgi:uncharacterized protein YjiK